MSGYFAVQSRVWFHQFIYKSTHIIAYSICGWLGCAGWRFTLWCSIFAKFDLDHIFAHTRDLVRSDALCRDTNSSWSVEFDRHRSVPISRWNDRFRRTAPSLRCFLATSRCGNSERTVWIRVIWRKWLCEGGTMNMLVYPHLCCIDAHDNSFLSTPLFVNEKNCDRVTSGWWHV